MSRGRTHSARVPRLLPQSFYRRDTLTVARELLGKRLRRGPVTLEITRDGEVVWEFFNPNRRNEPDGAGTQREAIYRMTRVEPGALPLSHDRHGTRP